MVKIVRAKKNHISDIGKLWLEFSQFHQDIDPIVTPLDDARQGFDKEFVTRLMKSKEGLVLVALDDRPEKEMDNDLPFSYNPESQHVPMRPRRTPQVSKSWFDLMRGPWSPLCVQRGDRGDAL